MQAVLGLAHIQTSNILKQFGKTASETLILKHESWKRELSSADSAIQHLPSNIGLTATPTTAFMRNMGKYVFLKMSQKGVWQKLCLGTHTVEANTPRLAKRLKQHVPSRQSTCHRNLQPGDPCSEGPGSCRWPFLLSGFLETAGC